MLRRAVRTLRARPALARARRRSVSTSCARLARSDARKGEDRSGEFFIPYKGRGVTFRDVESALAREKPSASLFAKSGRTVLLRAASLTDRIESMRLIQRRAQASNQFTPT